MSKILVDWSERYSSSASKEVLIKSVAQAVPTYVMSVFKLPFSVCDDLSKLMRHYWWGVQNGKKKMAWDKLVLPKSKGGMGFRDMRAFNQALLAKQAWRLLVAPESLCARLLRAKYYPNGNLLDTVFPSNSSAVWKGIEHGLNLVKKGMIWRVGNGNLIRTWRDPWIPRGMPFTPISPKRNCRLNKVADFLDANGAWKVNLLEQFFCHVDLEVILKIRTSPRQREYFIAWPFEKSGSFTVRSAYHLAMGDHMDRFSQGASSTCPGGERGMWNIVWRALVRPKMKVFA